MFTFSDTDLENLAYGAFAGEAGGTAYRGEERHAGRYIVGGIRFIVTRTGKSVDYYRDVITRLISENDALKAETLGYWLDGDLYYFDLGDTYHTLAMALQTASQRGELAIWDRLEGKAISVR